MTGEEPNEADPAGWRRWWNALARAARWALDVFRGTAGSRQLEKRNE